MGNKMGVPSLTRIVIWVLICVVSGCAFVPLVSDNHTVLSTDADAAQAEVIEPIAAGSYWNNSVRYPFQVNYAKALDARQQAWTLAYIDEYRGQANKSDAPVVVLVHCRCGNLGYFTRLIRKLRSQYRVIAFDLPHYGKSLPANLDLPVNQSFADSRQWVQQVLREQLGITKINLIGHSLGGQWAIGFALAYPDYVESMVLESSYGLEAYHEQPVPSVAGEINLFDGAFTGETTIAESVWRSSPLLTREYSLTEAELEARFFGTAGQTSVELPLWARSKLDVQNNTPETTGIFQQNQPDARFFVRSRALAAIGDLQEYEALVKACVWDMYASAAELRASDKKNLASQLGQIRARTFLAFGQQDSFLPNTAMTGKHALKAELAEPALNKIRAGGAAGVAKIYAYAAHTPHIEVAEQFEADVLRFFEGKAIELSF